ncbi:protein serine/threonine phosphatase 2C [Bimuria novae-zelandiae CBS 107.79]|uniref:Protein serine/threonine phosphatase 2C n=1 Tax=Bimuria novae-zelandiae CBS 107.79 TaxID=1447943 RepID=A0A6A5VBZ7_9PLEO|nr:protein serine/threonine phosphatase 2C [Bimuria novae-zelandiae CBS 107.79]
MLQTRWGGFAARIRARNACSTSRTRNAASGFHTYPGLRAPAAPQRVQITKSRVSTLLCKPTAAPETSPALLSINGPIHHSAFPTKTAIFLVILGVAAYYLVEVTEEGWVDRVLASFNGDPAATPLHFYKRIHEVDHWIEQHIPDPSMPLKDPEVLRQISEQFPKIVFGWEIEEEDSREFDIPITHGIRFRSNEPCEDYYAVGTAPGLGSKPWNYWSVFDGHAGRHTAYTLQWTLHPHLSRALSSLSPTSTSSEIHSTIKDVFLKIDDGIMSRAKTAANWFPAANAAAVTALTPAFSGSCALLAAFDPEQSKLRVACVGDSRAVLGRWDPLERKYVAQPLSIDQTGFNESEVTRIQEAHPGEDDILDAKSGRLMGLAVTRAFGDHRWKWDNDFIKQLQAKFWGTAPRPQSKTPPYLTAEPEITETEIVRADPKDKSTRSDFMIMASDGLWDHISSEHAVECVERWLEAKERGKGKVTQDPKLQQPAFLPNVSLDQGLEYDAETGEQVSWKAEPQYFAIEDDNAAVCLARNAMGGTRRGLFLGLLSIPGPLSRYAVDDTTVMVVFFDHVAEDKKKNKPEGEKKSAWWPW